MAERAILITIKGEGGNYAAEIQRVTDKTNQFNKAAVQGAQQTMKAYADMGGVLGGLKTQLLGLVGVGALVGLAKQAIDTAGRIQDLSEQTHISGRTLSGLRTIVEQSGGTLEDFANGIVRLQKSLVDSRDKQDGFSLKMRDLLKLSSDPEKFLEGFAKKLASIKNPAEQTAFALEAASRGGAKLAPVFLAIAKDGLEPFRNSASAMSNETIARLDELGDAVTEFKNNTISAFAQGVGSLGDFSSAVRQFGSYIGDTLSFIIRHKEAILLLGGVVAALTGHWLTAAAALAAYLGLSNQYRGTLGQLNALNEKELALQQQLLIVEESRRRGQRSGITSDVVLDKLKEEQSKVAKQKQELIDLLRQENDKPSAASKIPGLNPSDEGAKKAAQERLQFLEQLKDKLRAAQAQFEGLSDPQRAALTQLSELEEKARKFNSPTMTNLVETIKLYTLAVIEKNREDEKQKAIIEQVTAINKNLADSEAAEIKRKDDNRAAIEAEFALKERLLDLDIERLRIVGLEDIAARQQLEGFIALNKQRRAALDAADIERKAGEFAEIDKRTANAELKLKQLGNTSIDIVGEVTKAASDIVNAAINGTLKAADVGRSILATFVRFGIDQFTLFLRRIQQQAQLAQVTAAATTSGATGGGTSGGGGFLQNIFSSFGGGGGGGGSGGGGGFLQNIMGMFGGGGASSAGAGIGNMGDRFAGMPGAAGGGLGAGISGMLDSGGGMLAGLFGGMMTGGSGGPLGVGGQILGSLASSAMMSGISIGLGGAGGLMGGLVTAISGAAMVPVVGWIVAAIAAVVLAITSIFGAQKPNPSVMVKSKIDGFFYSELENQFKAGNVVSKARGIDGIPQSAVNSTKTAVQQLLEGLSKQWTAILNLFPVIVHKDMIPKLEAANKLLNVFFGKLKFSEGGSNTIQQEIARLAGRTGPEGFFHALRGTIGAGLTASIKAAGLGDLSELVNKTFAESDPNSTFASIRTGPGLKAPRLEKDIQPFFEAIGKFVGLTSGLAGVSKSGITPFLTEQDLARTTSQISEVLKITDGKQFTQAVDQLEAELKPVLEFLQKSVQETTSLFSRGMIAALEAVSESGAIQAFNKNLGEGVKSMIFQGITEAFIASAQFNDLLAPIQQTIREFTQQAINSGEAPDIDAFRRAILPDVEDITMRAEMLGPLLAELQKLGIDVKDALKALTGSATAGKIEINFSGAVSVRSEADIEDISRRLASLISGALPPV